jgi:hypothetical protein
MSGLSECPWTSNAYSHLCFVHVLLSKAIARIYSERPVYFMEPNMVHGQANRSSDSSAGFSDTSHQGRIR